MATPTDAYSDTIKRDAIRAYLNGEKVTSIARRYRDSLKRYIAASTVRTWIDSFVKGINDFGLNTEIPELNDKLAAIDSQRMAEITAVNARYDALEVELRKEFAPTSDVVITQH